MEATLLHWVSNDRYECWVHPTDQLPDEAALGDILCRAGAPAISNRLTEAELDGQSR